MKSWLVVFHIAFLCMSTLVRAEIVQADRLGPIEAALKTADAKTLVVFDIDNVLTGPRINSSLCCHRIRKKSASSSAILSLGFLRKKLKDCGV